jgi:hypothetical protein
MAKVPAADDQEPEPRGDEFPDVVRDAVTGGWGRTVRLCMVLVAERMPALAALLLWLASRR